MQGMSQECFAGVVASEPQQSREDWLQARCGSLGASAIHEVVAKTKSGPAASRANLCARLVIERITGKPLDAYQSAAMLQGIEREPEARAAYSFLYDCDVEQVGLVKHPTITGTHASPDGLIGSDGLVEFKCPQLPAHLEALLGQPIPQKYILQMQWQMACTGRAWCDFVSYSPNFPEHMRLYVKRIPRDPAMIRELEIEVVAFLAEVDGTLAKLAAAFGAREAAE